MTTFGVTRVGQDSYPGATGSGDQALFLKKFANEVLLAYQRYTVTDGRVRERRIESGKSAQFPVFGAASSGYHTPGQNLITEGGATPTYLQQPKTSEKVITIDGIMQSSALIADIDEAMSHYDVRAPFARELGWALAKEQDVRTLMTIFFGSSLTATFTGDASDWGSTATRQIVDADFETSATSTKATLKLVAKRMDEDDVPEEGRHVALRPETYQGLASDSELSSRDYNVVARGDQGTGKVLMYQGIHLHKTNRITDLRGKGNYTSALLHAEEHGTQYIDDYTNAFAVAWQQDSSVGVVKLRTLEMQMQYKLEYLATLMVAGYAQGHGVLHESACYSVVAS